MDVSGQLKRPGSSAETRHSDKGFSEKVLLDTVHKTKVKTSELGRNQNNYQMPTEQKSPACVSMLHVDYPRELLHSVQQEVAFLYGFLILPVLTVGPERESESC